MQRYLLASVLLVGLLTACREGPALRPQPGVDVLHYDVHLRIGEEAPRLAGRATLTVHLHDTVEVLRLELTGLTVDTLRVDGAPVEPERRSEVLLVPGPWPPGDRRIDVHYAGSPTTGFYRTALDGATVHFTDSWPTRGSGWLPGVHHPSDPATLRMILDTPLGPDVIATGALHRRDTLRTGVRTVWALDVPAPTYAFAFALAPFAYEEDTTATGLPVGSYSLPGGSPIDVSLPSVARAAEVLTALLGPYPYASYRAAQVPIAYAGMENASLAFIDPALTGDARTTVLVHELAHQWFGNHVALAGWEDLWLSEGMATYLATHVLEQHDPEAARARWIDVARLTPRRRRALVPLVRPPLGAPERHLTWVVYEKGASVLYLLRQTLGDAVFAQVLRETVRRYADQPLSTEAFQAVAEEASGHSLDDWFGVWVYGGEVPRLTARWNPKRRMLRWAVEGDGGTLAGVPVNLRIQQDGRGYDVPLPAQKTTLPRTTLPEIHPVGVMLDVKVLRDRTSDLPD